MNAMKMNETATRWTDLHGERDRKQATNRERAPERRGQVGRLGRRELERAAHAVRVDVARVAVLGADVQEEEEGGHEDYRDFKPSRRLLEEKKDNTAKNKETENSDETRTEQNEDKERKKEKEVK